MSLRRLALLVAAAVLAAVALAPAAGARKHKTPTKVVKVGDDYFAPTNFTKRKRLKVGTKIVWKWRQANYDTHDVKLTKAPKKVRHFHSRPATAGYSFSWTFKKTGKYRVICTFHPNAMIQNITVVK